MSHGLGLLILAATLVSPLISAAQAEPLTCRTAQFSEKVLALFPSVRGGCRGITTRGGQDYAVFNSNLTRVSGGGVTVRLEQADGSSSKPRYIRLSPGFRALVDGRKVRAGQLSVGQELVAYVKLTEPKVALAPADERSALELTSLDAVGPPAMLAAPSDLSHIAASPRHGTPEAGLLLVLFALYGTRPM